MTSYISDDPPQDVNDDTEGEEDTIKGEGDEGAQVEIENEDEKEDEQSKVVDEDSDAPDAGTPGHPGIDEGTA